MGFNSKPLIGFLAVAALWSMDVSDQGPLRLRFVREAHAIVGAPLTPVSVAGVARRTTRRTVAVAASTPPPAPAPAPAKPGAPPAVGSMVTALPPGCAPTKLNGVDYQRCGSTYYTASFMGPNLVFTVAQP